MRFEKIGDEELNAARDRVSDGVCARLRDQDRILIDAGDAHAIRPLRQAERGRANAAAGVQHVLARCGNDGSGEQHGINRRPIARARLPNHDTTAEQPVFRPVVRAFIHHIVPRPCRGCVDQSFAYAGRRAARQA